MTARIFASRFAKAPYTVRSRRHSDPHITPHSAGERQGLRSMSYIGLARDSHLNHLNPTLQPHVRGPIAYPLYGTVISAAAARRSAPVDLLLSCHVTSRHYTQHKVTNLTCGPAPLIASLPEGRFVSYDQWLTRGHGWLGHVGASEVVRLTR